MREILFRGKTPNDEWVEGFLCKKYFQEAPHDRLAIMYKTEYDPKRWNPDYMTAEVLPETVGQYTGLTDKNGNKIFEGDILEIDGSIYEVVFRNGTFGVSIRYGSYAGSILAVASYVQHFIKVIGNIHDNPELLKEGANNGNL